MRKTLFLQKKIKLLNVEFATYTVYAQTKDIFTLFDVDFSVKLNARQKLVGMVNNTRLATPNKHVKILFKSTFLITSGNITLFRRIFLEILNNL